MGSLKRIHGMLEELPQISAMRGKPPTCLHILHIVERTLAIGPSCDSLQRYVERHLAVDEGKEGRRISENEIQELEHAVAAGNGAKQRRPGLLHYTLIQKNQVVPAVAESFEAGSPSAQAGGVSHGLGPVPANGEEGQRRAP
jgi:hypothetical protein